MESQPQNLDFRNISLTLYNMHAQLSSGGKGLNFVLNTHLHPYFV